MSREVATSREIATRESADRSNQYIVENDFRLFSSGASNNYVILPNLSSYFNTLPLLVEFFWNRYSHSGGAWDNLFYANSHLGVNIFDFDLDRVDFLYFVNGSQYIENVIHYGDIKDCHYVSFLISNAGSKIYIDAKIFKTQTWHGTPSVAAMSGNYYLFSSGSAHLAKQEISHFSVWNPTDITNISSEILARYNNFQDGIFLNGDETDLRGYWKLNEGVGTTVVDSTENENHGTITGCEWRQYGGLREVA